MSVGQDTSFDTFNYQWYDAYAFLDGRLGTDVFPGDQATAVSPFIDVPYYALMHAFPPVIAAGLLGALQGLNPILIFFIAKKVSSSRWVALACALTATIAAGFLYELGSTSADSVVSIPLLLGVLLAVNAIRQPARARRPKPNSPVSADGLWLLSGLCEGIGAGLKLAEAPFAIAAAAAAVFTTRGVVPRVRRLLITTLGLLLGLGLSYGYWAVALWRRFGDPLFADLSTVRFFPSRFISSSYLQAVSQQPSRYGPHSWVTYLLYPFYWILHPDAAGDSPLLELSIPLAYLLVLLLGALQLSRRLSSRGQRHSVDRNSPERAVDAYLIFILVATLAVWEKLFGIYRYLIVLELLAPVIIFSIGRRGLAVIRPRLARHPKLRYLPGVTLVALLLACVLTVLVHPSGYGSRVGYASRFISLRIPLALRARRPDVVIQEESAPMAIFDPELPSWITAVGYLDGENTPATHALVKAAIARAQRAGGAVVIDYAGTASQVLGANAPANDAYLQSEGVTGYELQGASCQSETAKLGASPVLLTFCKLHRIGTG